MTEPAPRYWFRAKTYGWGWGLPLRWQGWAVLVGFVVLLGLGGLIFPPPEHAALYLSYVLGLSAAVVGICYLKGEPPKWRWGAGKGDDATGSVRRGETLPYSRGHRGGRG